MATLNKKLSTIKPKSSRTYKKTSYEYDVLEPVSHLPTGLQLRGRESRHIDLYTKIQALEKGKWIPVKIKNEKGANGLASIVRAWFYKHDPQKVIHVAFDIENKTAYFSWSKVK